MTNRTGLLYFCDSVKALKINPPGHLSDSVREGKWDLVMLMSPEAVAANHYPDYKEFEWLYPWVKEVILGSYPDWYSWTDPTHFHKLSTHFSWQVGCFMSNMVTGTDREHGSRDTYGDITIDFTNLEKNPFALACLMSSLSRMYAERPHRDLKLRYTYWEDGLLRVVDTSLFDTYGASQAEKTHGIAVRDGGRKERKQR